MIGAAPWPIKIAGKLVLSRLPIPYGFWSGLGMFRHGQMATLEYPRKIFALHRKAAEEHGVSFQGAKILEMGTGDSVAASILGKGAGVETTFMVDVGDFASRDMSFYRRLASEAGVDLGGVNEFSEMLARVNGVQLTTGLAAWRSIPPDTVDFVWSHSTVEHIRKGEFDATFQAMFRVLKPGGIASHNVDLKDHLEGALNNLRFSERLWEADWWANSGFYTNRLRPTEIRQSVEAAGFLVEEFVVSDWSSMPTRREVMNLQFRSMTDADLRARSLRMVLRKP